LFIANTPVAHPNFGSVVGEGGIDPFIDDAGLQQERTGFADPTLQGSSWTLPWFLSRKNETQ